MYTQCPECGAVYRITSAHLKQAAGEVQCGQCEARFDALDRLSDVFPKSASGAAPRMPLQQDAPESERPPPSDEQAPSEETSDQRRETEFGDEPSESTDAPDQYHATADEQADEQADQQADQQAEDTVEASEAASDERRKGDQEAGDGDGAPEEAETEEAVEEDRPAADSEPDEAAPEDLGPEAERREDAAEPAPGEDDDEPTIDLDQTAEQLFALEDLSDQVVPDLDRLEFSEGLPLESEAGEAEGAGEEASPPEELTGRRSGRFARWTARALVIAAVVGLGAYLVHGQRGLLMRNPTLAPWLETVYGRLGMTVETTWDVGRFRILDSSAELDASGDLQVRLSFMNEGDFTQPYPVLRIVLEDRWGDEIGSRDLPPADYLSGYVAGRGFRPAERATGRATVIEPGLVAVGFRLDLCLPGGSGRSMDCLSEQP